MRRRVRVSFLVMALSASGLAQGEHPHLHLHKAEGTPPPGKPRVIPHTDERAGFPRSVAGHAEPSKTSGGVGYYVGGGVSRWGHPHPKGPEDGTWGWDDTGWHAFRRRSVLGWSHGRKHQGGTGAYRTDGPHIPDPVLGLTTKVNGLHRAEGEE